MALISTPFVPQVNGFRFVNRFDALPEVNFPLIGPVDLGEKIIGLCGGMAFAALDYLNYAVPLTAQTDVEKIDPALRGYLIRRQIDSLGLFTLTRVVGWMLRDDADVLGYTAREVGRICAQIDAGRPAVLCLVRVAGLSDPTANHQVVAAAYERDPANVRLALHLYDPNHPGEEPRLELELAPGGEITRLAQSSGERLRAFFAIPYSPQPPPNVP